MNNQVKVLVIEDDPYISDLIGLYAEKSGYTISIAHNGLKGLEMFYESPPDLVILDIMMPEMDGWEVCKEIRRFDKTPVIMLTGKGENCDKLKGFDLGTDDYLVKPFDPNELMARIKAVLRRANPMLEADEIIDLPKLNINLKQYKVTCDEQEILLPPKEMKLLYFLTLHSNQVFTRQQLLDQIWGWDFGGDPKTVDVHIKRIREKLGDSNPFWRVKTIRGIGYKFEVDNQ
ncbi:response regulator transcription factor [Paenibacillus chondroitinus]|uniref:Response regulator transcription factor n=1 Tax=Paenibacillus chondroitinus TaxID=59842 RepID=A0ABU6DGD5_9BACL|nr:MULTISPECIES: response regulator transcription factor [Paenibacillus]MCY9659431.1 response regulator transcription factor [Paenibacillus anseongense]MEB4796826.1 response regulator transcription factor [Paenibacillus chondroitinus]